MREHEERRIVTILFADIAGSTALADSMDFEDVRALMSRYYDHARRIIATYGGTLEKFIGDAVVAIFGLTQAHGDDPERALSAALDLRSAIADDEILSPLLRLRIGVNTGEVMATNNPDRLDFLVTGDAVNVSARLQQGAAPGEIIVSERTAKATQHSFLFGEERQIQAKGKPQPLRVFPLKGPSPSRHIERPPFVGRQQDLLQLAMLKDRALADRQPQFAFIVAPAGTGKSRLFEEFLARLDPAEGFQTAIARCLPYGQTLTYQPLRDLLTALLGGAPEKDHIESIFHQAGQSEADATQLASLIMTTLGTEKDGNTTHFPLSKGSAKAGKKRKSQKKQTDDAAELNDALAMLENIGKLGEFPAVNNWAKSIEKLGPQIALDPQSKTDNWIKKFIGLDDLDTSDGSPKRLNAEQLSTMGRSLQGRGKELGDIINERVNRILSQTLPSRFYAADSESIFTAWNMLIEALTRQTPRIIVFEDLHWGSDALLDLVEHFTHLCTDAGLLFVVLSRPELLDKRPVWGSSRPNLTILPLQPLGEAETRELLTHVQADIPRPIQQKIIERASGNPFFALELIQGYTERVQRGDATTGVTLPDTVHAAVLARIDQLLPLERILLQVASVADSTLNHDLLLALLDEHRASEIDEALTGLQNRDLLHALDGEQYAFHHALIRDVAYGTLPRAERVRLHSQIALWLQASAADHLEASIGLISYHYREAILLSRQSAIPLQLPFKTEDAARIFELAGLIAGRSGSYAEARDNLQLAIDLAPASEHVRLYEELGESVPHWDIAYDAFRKALASWRTSLQRQLQTGARLLRKLLIAGTRNAAVCQLTWQEADALRQEALALLAIENDEEERWRVRLTECFDPRFLDDKQRPSLTNMLSQKRELAREAAAYFDDRKSWEALSEALDACSLLSIYMQALPDALAASQRRLSIPDLPAGEWADANNAVAACHFILADYHACIASARTTLAHLKAGRSAAGLGQMVSMATMAAYLCGRWDEIASFLTILDEIRSELLPNNQSSLGHLLRGYHAALLLALAREDRPMIDATAVLVRQCATQFSSRFSTYLDALLEDDAAKIVLDDPGQVGDTLRLGLLLFLNEHDQPMPTEMLALLSALGSDYRYWSEISLALTANDTARLTSAINKAEAHQLIPHAARMRIILAQRTNDPAPLAQARPVLERLGDSQFLRRLEEIASTST